jgi:TATA-box binding protein (TBP) (component of TFIID and TFIIIB)
LNLFWVILSLVNGKVVCTGTKEKDILGSITKVADDARKEVVAKTQPTIFVKAKIIRLNTKSNSFSKFSGVKGWALNTK